MTARRPRTLDRMEARGNPPKASIPSFRDRRRSAKLLHMRVAAHALLAATSLLAFGASHPLYAQGPYKVGARYEAFPNPTGTGSKQLLASVYYPAKRDGFQTPIIRQKPGLPVLVFLHGYGALGYMYPELAFDWARAGYVVVLQNTAATDPQLQILDGAAIHTALVRESVTPNSFYAGAIDTTRMVVAGHSMGGANSIHILANNPGYRAGFAWSPFAGNDGKYTQSVGPRIKVPFAIATGVSDKVTPWKRHSQPVYDNLPTNRVKFLYTFDEAGDHSTVVSWLRGKQPDARNVFTRSMLVARALFNHVLYSDPGSLDHAIGLSGRSERHLRQLQTDVEAPYYIKRGVDRLGQVALFQLVAPRGYAIHMLALRRVAIPTAAGTLHLDPASIFILQVTNQTSAGIALYPHTVPTDPRMRGLAFPVQALLVGSQRLELSNELYLAVPK